MFRLVLVMLAVQNCSTLRYPKCCDSDSVLEKNDFRYTCVKDLDKRTQVVSNETNFVGSFQEGFCVDFEGSVGLFKNNGSDLIKVKNLDFDFYPKCCPVNYFYNSTTHGCVKSENEQERFFGESVVKVGLPHCKVIEDISENTNEFLENLNGRVYLNNKNKIGQGFYCIDKNQNDSFILRICHENYDICDTVKCVRKCCPDGQSFINGSFCHNTYVHGLDFSTFAGNMDNTNDSFATIHDGYTPPLYPLAPERFFFHLDAKGIFTMTEVDESLGKFNVTRHYDVDERKYCIEHAVKKTFKKFSFFREFYRQTQIKFIYTGVAMIISCVFLALTILYYCFSGEKKSLFGKILISYCITSFMALLLISYFSLNSTRPPKGSIICIVIAFMVFYLTLSVFTWMNVMCIDIYCTFGSSASFAARQYKSREVKRFLFYCLHGWGTPLILTIIPLIFYHTTVLPSILQVVIKEEKCFWYKGDGNYGQFLFSTIPISLLQICNIVLFIRTSSYCLQVKKEINRMNDTQVMKGEKKKKFNNFRDRFGLLLKLFFIMGISFLFEVVSTFYDFKQNYTTAVIEIIWDTFNSLQGVFIFAIFILKKRIFKKFEEKIGLKKLRKISVVSMGMTQTTSLPALSK